VLARLSGGVLRGATRGGKGGTIPRAPNHCGGRGKIQTVSQVLSSIQCIASKTTLNFEHGGAKLASCRGHHLTSLRPWMCCNTEQRFRPYTTLVALSCFGVDYWNFKYKASRKNLMLKKLSPVTSQQAHCDMIPEQWIWLLCSATAIPKNKLSLQYLNQLIGIKLLTSGFLEILVRIPISRGKMTPMPTTIVPDSIKHSATLTFKSQFKKHLLHEKSK